MRKDVNKVLTECYKEGPHDQKFPRRTTAKIFDEVGGKVGMQYEHVRTPKHGTKSFGENLGYLQGFLRKNIGRNWDDVYSEVCSSFDRRRVVNEHIFQHLMQDVTIAKHVRVLDGVLYEFNGGYHRELVQTRRRGWGSDFFVDPRDGLLKFVPYRAPEKSKWELERETTKAKVKRLSPLLELHQLEDGLWYVFEIKPIPPNKEVYVFNRPEPVLGSSVEERMEYHRARRDFDASSSAVKKALGRRELIRPDLGDLHYKIDSVNKSKLVTGGFTRGAHRRKPYLPATHYYASMRSASKKELRQAGL